MVSKREIKSNTPSKPVSKFTSNRDTHAIKQKGNDFLFATLWQPYLVYFALIAVGFIGFLYSLSPLGGVNLEYAILFAIVLLTGLAFTFEDHDYLLRKSDLKLFDIERRFYFRKSVHPLDNFTPIRVQVIRKRVIHRTEIKRYNSFEVNLVSDEGEQITVLNFGKLDSAVNSANRIGNHYNLNVEISEKVYDE
ncbi:TPA: hypothetical protein N2902_004634 [Vibrio parahaemolyticus]|nr:hypothetical protein [Vibrio parahaemolyticus]